MTDTPAPFDPIAFLETATTADDVEALTDDELSAVLPHLNFTAEHYARITAAMIAAVDRHVAAQRAEHGPDACPDVIGYPIDGMLYLVGYTPDDLVAFVGACRIAGYELTARTAPEAAE